MFETSKILKTILGKKFYSKFLIITLLQVVAVLLEIFSISLIIPIIDIFLVKIKTNIQFIFKTISLRT